MQVYGVTDSGLVYCVTRIDVALCPIRRYSLFLRYEWNPTKRASNLAKHGIEFEAVDDFEWDTALIEADVRRSYGEVRLVAYGRINGRLHTLVYTIRRTSTWVISLRRASNKEVRHYESEG